MSIQACHELRNRLARPANAPRERLRLINALRGRLTVLMNGYLYCRSAIRCRRAKRPTTREACN